MIPAAIIFDFDGVIIDSESVANAALAEALTAAGYATSIDDSLSHYMGHRWDDTRLRIEARWNCVLPESFREDYRAVFQARVGEGLPEVGGVAEFLDRLPDRPRAIASSSSTQWLASNLDRLGLRHHFGDRLFSGAEHVERGKPHPDVYLHAAAEIGVEAKGCWVVEDTATGATAALAAGMRVIGLCAGSHCRADHGDRLQAAGVHHIAHDYAKVARLIGLAD